MREVVRDPGTASIPGKIRLRGRLCQKLAVLGGEALVEAPVLTPSRLLVADVAWASVQFIKARANETPFRAAPELCIELVAPCNSAEQLREKIDLYLGAGAHEVWIVYPQFRRWDFHGKQGPMQRSRYPVDLAALFA